MKNVSTFILLLALTSGCAHQTAQNISPKYSEISKAFFQINLFDGISTEEAIILAQNHLIFSGEAKNYYVTSPQLHKIQEQALVFRFTPIHKTLSDSLHKPEILVYVDRHSGQTSAKKDYSKKI